MAENPAREQRTPRQSHSSGSYGETCMGEAERFRRDGEEPFVLDSMSRTNPLECNMSLVLITTRKEVRERKWPIPDSEDAVVCRYKYFSMIASDLGFSYNLRWFLASNPGEDLTREQIKKYFPDKQPRIGIWEHYALFIIFGPPLLLALLGH